MSTWIYFVSCSIVSSASAHILQRIYSLLYARWSTVFSASSCTSKRTHLVFYAQCSNVSSASAHTLQRTHPLTMATIFLIELLLDLGVFLVWNTVTMVTMATKFISITQHVLPVCSLTTFPKDSFCNMLSHILPKTPVKISSFFLYFLMNYD